MDIFFPETRLVEEAVSRASDPAGRSLLSGAGQGVSVGPPGASTFPVEIGDAIFDGHDFLTELDSTEDEAALTS